MSDQQPAESIKSVVSRAGSGLGPSMGSILKRVGSTTTDMVQRDGAPPVIENSALSSMSDALSSATQASRLLPGLQHLIPGRNVMGNDSSAVSAVGAHMAAVPAAEEVAVASALPAVEQVPLAVPAAPAGAPKESYLRIAVTVNGSDVQITHVSEVDGPLAPPEPLYGGLGYEVSVGGRSVRVGGIPDPGVRRSFAGPQAPPEQQQHFFVQVPSYDFTVRVPKQAVSAATLPQMHIAVYQLDGSQVIQPVADTPLAKQFPQLVQEVTRLAGVNVQQLADPVRSALTEALG